MAFSFLNGKSPFDEAEERLEAGETINGKPKMPKAPVMGWSDGIFVLVIIAAVVGGYQYYKYAKGKTAEVYGQCQALYEACATDASKYIEMEECYKSTLDLSFTSDSLEILGQNRLVEVDSMRFIQQGFLTDAKSLLNEGDTAGAANTLKSYKGAMLLNGVGEKAEWEKIQSLGK